MHGHVSARAERVHTDNLWGESKSGHSHLQILVPDGGDDVGYADGVEAMIGGKISDGGGGIAYSVPQAKEDADALLD